MADRVPILILDDDNSLVSEYKLGFEAEGFEVYTAGDGEAGLKKAQEVRPALIITDLMMPKMNGHQFLEAISKDESLVKIPVVAISALIPEVGKEQTEGMKVKVHYMEKSGGLETIIPAVKKLIG